jgi:hypothetical protein
MEVKHGVLAALLFTAFAGSLPAEEPNQRIEAFWVLMHEPAVIEEL